MILKSNCKLNLHLKVVNKRIDGYHNLESIFVEIPFYDVISLGLVKSKSIILKENGLKIPPCSENICITAARVLQEESRCNLGCEIKLCKNIPMGAGLGGGSSDAATVLKGLNKLWSLNYSDNILEKIAVKIGADVPFFIRGGSALVTGVGDVLEPINSPLKKGFIVLVNKGIHISTKEAYKNVKKILTLKKKRVKLSSLFEKSKNEWNYELFENDFENYAFGRYPELKRLKDIMYEEGAYLAGMTGSGSTIFGCFSGKKDISLNKIKDSSEFINVIKVNGENSGNY